MSPLKPVIFSFFSGAGFLDLGFEDSGFEIAYVNENHRPFLDAYQHSRSVLKHSPPEFGYDDKSIKDVSSHSIQKCMDAVKETGVPVGFIGGPPCPDFSVGGKNRGKEGENGKLSKVYVDLICKTKPDFFLFENVKGLYRTKKHRDFFESLKVSLKKHGYALHERLINSIQYGAPQDRDRIILVGFRNKTLARQFEWLGQEYPNREAFEFDWPTTCAFGSHPHKPRNKSIPQNLTVQHWFDRNKVDTHPNAQHCFQPRAGLAKFQTIDEGDDSKKSYKRLHRWRYSPTAAYGNNEVHLHPYKARRLNVAEVLAIQSLPKKFELPASMTLSNMFKTVGNGVPYLAAKGLAQSIHNHLGVQNALNRRKFSSGHKQSAA